MNDYQQAEGTETRRAKLISPLFFPGQLLTNEDLDTLKEWARARFALLRPRDGWGVVCGLDVYPFPDKPSALKVTAGYAVDCPGNDVLLLEETCAEIEPASGGGSDCASLNPPASTQQGDLYAGPYAPLPLSKLAVFDLMLLFHAEEMDPVAAFNRKGTRSCKNTRALEQGIAKFVPVPWGEVEELKQGDKQPLDPTKSEAIQLLKDFKNDDTVKEMFTAPLPSSVAVASKAENVKQWLLARLEANSSLARIFPTLKDWLTGENGLDALSTPWGVARVLFWITDAVRRPQSSCDGCEDEPCGVPLARVWAELVGGTYYIRVVDIAPPARKVMRCEDDADWTVGADVGRRGLDVQRDLARLNIPCKTETFEIPADGKHLLEILEQEPTLTTGVAVVAMLSERMSSPGSREAPNVEPLAGRVAAFREGTSTRKPLTTHDTSLLVKLLPMPTEPTTEEVVWGDPSSETLDCVAIPFGPGGWIKIQVTPKSPGDFQGADFFLFDELRNAITGFAPLPTWDASKVAIATFKLPPSPKPGLTLAKPEVSLLLRKASPAPQRLVAIEGLLEKSVQDRPLTNNLPELDVNLVLAPGHGDRNIRPLAFVRFKSLPVPLLTVKFAVKNPCGSTIKATIQRLETAPPDDPKWDTLGTSTKDISVDHGDHSQPIPDEFELAVTNQPEFWFWLVKGKDAFHRPFMVVPRAASRLAVVPTEIDLKIEAAGAGFNLKIVNATIPIIVGKLSARRGVVGDPVSISLPNAGLPIDAGKESSPLALPTAGSGNVWTLWIDLEREGKKLTGVVNVTST